MTRHELTFGIILRDLPMDDWNVDLLYIVTEAPKGATPRRARDEVAPGHAPMAHAEPDDPVPARLCGRPSCARGMVGLESESDPKATFRCALGCVPRNNRAFAAAVSVEVGVRLASGPAQPPALELGVHPPPTAAIVFACLATFGIASRVISESRTPSFPLSSTVVLAARRVDVESPRSRRFITCTSRRSLATVGCSTASHCPVRSHIGRASVSTFGICLPGGRGLHG